MKSFLRWETTQTTKMRELSAMPFQFWNPCTHMAKSDKFTTNDCANLLQHSLNKCTIILRRSKNILNTEHFKFWSEQYYQSLLLLFFRERRTHPLQIENVANPQIMDAWFVRSPWHHLCEAIDKSNHHAHKDFQTKTMRSGTKLNNTDPLLFDDFFSYCHYLDIVSKHKRIPVSNTFDKLHKQFEQVTTYSEICKKVVKSAIIEICATRDSSRLLSGLRFHVVEHFTGTTGKAVEDTITCLGEGDGLLNEDKALGLSKRHSSTPNCFVVVKNDTELLRARKSENSSASGSDSDMCSIEHSTKNSASGNNEKGNKSRNIQGMQRICRHRFQVFEYSIHSRCWEKRLCFGPFWIVVWQRCDWASMCQRPTSIIWETTKSRNSRPWTQIIDYFIENIKKKSNRRRTTRR